MFYKNGFQQKILYVTFKAPTGFARKLAKPKTPSMDLFFRQALKCHNPEPKNK
jgi:hypothetical protein